jgi:hypothetical protein
VPKRSLEANGALQRLRLIAWWKALRSRKRAKALAGGIACLRGPQARRVYFGDVVCSQRRAALPIFPSGCAAAGLDAYSLDCAYSDGMKLGKAAEAGVHGFPSRVIGLQDLFGRCNVQLGERFLHLGELFRGDSMFRGAQERQRHRRIP